MSSSSSTPRTRGSHPIGPDKKRPWWLLLLVAVVGVVLLLLLLTRCGGKTDDTAGQGESASPPAVSSSAASAEPITPAATTGASPTAPESAAPSQVEPPIPVAPDGSLTAGAMSLLPLGVAAPDGSLKMYDGQPVTASAVRVLAVPADEGFWVGTSDTDRVWVQIVGSGESPYKVRPGDVVNFSGSMVGQGKRFARRVGLDASEGAQLLEQQGAHIAAKQSTLVPAAG